MKLGYVARDDNRKFLCARNNVGRQRAQPREADGLSLKEALIWTSKWRDKKCIFETMLVDAVNGVNGRSYSDPIAVSCFYLLKHLDKVNRVVHLLEGQQVLCQILRTGLLLLQILSI